jgi:hypothetical protein
MSFYLRTARLFDIEGMFDVRTSVMENHLSREEMRQMGITEGVVGDMIEKSLCHGLRLKITKLLASP